MSKTYEGVGSDWARHLKPYGKRTFWRKVRRKLKTETRKALISKGELKSS